MLEVRIDPNHCESHIELMGRSVAQIHSISDAAADALNHLFGYDEWYYAVRTPDHQDIYHWIIIHDDSDEAKLKSLEFNNTFGYRGGFP